MKKFWTKFILIILIMILGCGSGRKLPQNPQPLGFIPFSKSNMVGSVDELNYNLLTALKNSGSFYIQPLDTLPGLWDLPQMRTIQDSLIQYIITGQFECESQGQEKGRKIPFLLNTPKATITVELVYRLYSIEKEGWVDIGEVVVKNKMSGDIQVLEYDEAHPSLTLDAKERQILRKEAYRKAGGELVKRIEKIMNIK